MKKCNIEEMRKRVDEMHKLFDGARQNIDAIITILDEILMQEEDIRFEFNLKNLYGYSNYAAWKGE